MFDLFEVNGYYACIKNQNQNPWITGRCNWMLISIIWD